MKQLVLLLAILLIVCIGSAATISSSPVNVTLGSTGISTILLNTAPNGLAGCNVTVTIINTSVANIAGISFDTWASPHSNTGVPSNTVTFTEADFGNQKQAGASNIVLAFVTLNGLALGSTTLQVTVNACDDDLGGAINPSVSNGAIIISNSTTPSSGVGNYQIPPAPIQTKSNGGVHMLAATVDTTNKTVNLVGKIDNTATDPVAWFMIGDPPGTYSYFTVAYPPNSTGYVTIPFGSGAPLNPGEIYYVRIASVNGRSTEEITFTTSAPIALPTSNFSQYFYNMQYSNHSPLVMLAAIPLPYVDLFGGGFNNGQTPNRSFGWMIFFTIIFGMLCIILAVRQDNMIMVFEGLALAGGLIFAIIDPEFMWMIAAFIIIIAATILYRLYRKE
jgi:hypothetical protein